MEKAIYFKNINTDGGYIPVATIEAAGGAASETLYVYHMRDERYRVWLWRADTQKYISETWDIGGLEEAMVKAGFTEKAFLDWLASEKKRQEKKKVVFEGIIYPDTYYTRDIYHICEFKEGESKSQLYLHKAFDEKTITLWKKTSDGKNFYLHYFYFFEQLISYSKTAAFAKKFEDDVDMEFLRKKIKKFVKNF